MELVMVFIFLLPAFRFSKRCWRAGFAAFPRIVVRRRLRPEERARNVGATQESRLYLEIPASCRVIFQRNTGLFFR